MTMTDSFFCYSSIVMMMNPLCLINHNIITTSIAAIILVASILAADVVVDAFDCPNGKTPPLILKGKRFYDSSTDNYFPIRGIAYYPRPNDGPLSEGYSVDFFTNEFRERWETDIQNMKDLGVNAIRLYAVDPSQNHDAFMCALSEAGIYVTLGLLADCEGCAIGAWVGVDAEPPTCYPSSVKDRGQFVIKSFSRYPNLMAFSAGNEVSIYADDGTGGPRQMNVPCQKKFLKDMRRFVAECTDDGKLLPRAVPIGIENWDGNQQQFDQHVYYFCRTDPNDSLENAEWFGINSYRHCDGSATSVEDVVGWPELKSDFENANFPGPVLFGEYGCREYGFPTIDGFETQRTWLQTEALYTPEYSDVFAGGFVFEYSAEKKVIDDNLEFMMDLNGLTEPSSVWPYQKFAKENHGVGYFDPIDCQHDIDSKSCQYVRYPEFQLLMDQFAKTSLYPVNTQQRPGSIPTCPAQFPSLSSFTWPTDDESNPDIDYCLQNREQAREEENSITKLPTTAPSSIPPPVAVVSTAVPTKAIPIVDGDDEPPTTSITSRPTTSSTTSPTQSTTITIATPAPSKANSPNWMPVVSSNNDGDEEEPTSTTSSSPSLEATPTDDTNDSKPTTAPADDDNDASSSTPPTSSPTEVATVSAQCMDHSRCAASNLTGTCCPTADGISLGCCDTEPPTSSPLLEEEENQSEESSSYLSTSLSIFYWLAILSSTIAFYTSSVFH